MQEAPVQTASSPRAAASRAAGPAATAALLHSTQHRARLASCLLYLLAAAAAAAPPSPCPSSSPSRSAAHSLHPAPHHRPAAVGTGPTLQSAYAGFTDLNGNGLLDCGEPVDLIATFATNNSGTPALSGSLFAPVQGTSGLTFLHGSVVIDPVLTNGCAATIVTGNGSSDSDLRVDFTCPADPIDNNAWTLVVRYRATYTGTTTTFAAGAVANLSSGATLQNTATGQAGNACGGGGIPTDIALTKTAAGPATPGSLLVYTLTATDHSGAGDGGVQLVETVPALTTYSPTGSSPGWLCTAPPAGGPAGSPGSTCRNSIGNLPPNGAVAATFAVTLDPTFPAAPVVVANTACAYAGVTLATCASTTTPAAGTPTLHLAKALSSGASGIAIPGATLAYTLTAADTGNQALADVTLQETVPANTTFAAAASSTSWSCNPAAGTAGAACRLDLGPLAAQGASIARTFAVTIADPLPAQAPGATLANTACLTTSASGIAASCSTVDTPLSAQPVLHAAKSLRSGNGAPGTVLLYDLAVQNTGNEDAAQVVATETVPSNTTLDPAPTAGGAPGWTCDPAAGTAGATCTLAIGPVGAGTTAHVPFAVTVDLPLTAGITAIVNTACFQQTAIPPEVGKATTRLRGPTSTSDRSSLASLGGHPQQLLALSSDRPIRRGQPSTTSQTLATFPTLAISPTLATPPSFTAAAPLFASAGSRAARTRAAFPQADPPTCDTLSTPAQGTPLLTITKTYTGPPLTAGALLPFQLQVLNQGTQNVAAVTLTETVPGHTTFVAAQSTSGWSCNPASGTAGAACTLALGALAATAGASLTATFAVRAASPLPADLQQIANTACAAAPNLAPTCGQANTPPPAGTPQVTAELTYTFVRDQLGNGQAIAGDDLAYSLAVANPSPVAIENLSVQIPLDPNLTLDTGSVTATLGTVTAGNTRGDTAPTIQIVSLAPGATATIQFDASVGFLPAGLRLLSTQATLTAANAQPTVSDDPSTPQPLDPTTTPVGAAPTPTAAPIPTLTTWGLIALTGGLAAAALRRVRSRGAALQATRMIDRSGQGKPLS